MAKHAERKKILESFYQNNQNLGRLAIYHRFIALDYPKGSLI